MGTEFDTTVAAEGPSLVVDRRTLKGMGSSSQRPSGDHDNNSSDSRATPRGPSWGLMVFLILLAMLIAFGIAWAFVTPLLHRHF